MLTMAAWRELLPAMEPGGETGGVGRSWETAEDVKAIPVCCSSSSRVVFKKGPSRVAVRKPWPTKKTTATICRSWSEMSLSADTREHERDALSRTPRTSWRAPGRWRGHGRAVSSTDRTTMPSEVLLSAFLDRREGALARTQI